MLNTNTPLRPEVWGHRGAMDFAPQNTIPSFLLAAEQGATGVELDVQLTKDGVLVVFHDAFVDDLTDGRGPIASLPWAIVKKLDAGSHFGRAWAGTRIPTLEEVLEVLPSPMTINVELKTALSEERWWDRWLATVRGPRQIPGAVVMAARAEGRPLAEAVAQLLGAPSAQRFIVSSFDPYALEAFTSLSSVPVGFLHSPSGRWDTSTPMKGLAYQAWHPHHSEVTAQAVRREHEAGRKVHVWTVNDPRHAVQLAKLGVDAVITNRPGEILTSMEDLPSVEG